MIKSRMPETVSGLFGLWSDLLKKAVFLLWEVNVL